MWSGKDVGSLPREVPVWQLLAQPKAIVGFFSFKTCHFYKSLWLGLRINVTTFSLHRKTKSGHKNILQYCGKIIEVPKFQCWPVYSADWCPIKYDWLYCKPSGVSPWNRHMSHFHAISSFSMILFFIFLFSARIQNYPLFLYHQFIPKISWGSKTEHPKRPVRIL